MRRALGTQTYSPQYAALHTVGLVASLVVGRGWRILAQVQGAVEGRRQEAMTSASLRPPLKDQE